MLTASDARGADAPTVDEQFLDLICDDEELLTAEFEAIVAASWQVPPATARTARDLAGGGHRARGEAQSALRQLGVVPRGQRDRDPAPQARERSPPEGADRRPRPRT